MTCAAVRFIGTSDSCDSVLQLVGGPNPARCVWKSCTYDGGFIVTAKYGACEFSPGDWIIRDDAGGLHVCADVVTDATRKSQVVRDILFAMLAGEVSEGRAVEITGCDRVMLNEIKDVFIARGLRAAGTNPTPPRSRRSTPPTPKEPQ